MFLWETPQFWQFFDKYSTTPRPSEHKGFVAPLRTWDAPRRACWIPNNRYQSYNSTRKRIPIDSSLPLVICRGTAEAWGWACHREPSRRQRVRARRRLRRADCPSDDGATLSSVTTRMTVASLLGCLNYHASAVSPLLQRERRERRPGAQCLA